MSEALATGPSSVITFIPWLGHLPSPPPPRLRAREATQNLEVCPLTCIEDGEVPEWSSVEGFLWEGFINNDPDLVTMAPLWLPQPKLCSTEKEGRPREEVM